MSDVLEGIHYTATHRGIGPVLLLTVFIAFLGRPVVELLPGFVDVVFWPGLGGGGGSQLCSPRSVSAEFSPVYGSPTGAGSKE